MQQPALQFGAGGHQHGAGTLVSPVLLAEDHGGPGHTSSFDCQEWASNLHHRHAHNPRRPWISVRKLAPERWHSLFPGSTFCCAAIAVAVDP